MGYKKADSIFPKHLLDEIQKYVQGEYVYIPSNSSRKRWGEKSGARKELVKRNNKIRKEFKEGKTIEELANQFYLSINTIKKIVYSKGK
ncbi:MAG: hypothetical protein FH751_08840 [Firmicutes bacterium]|nr:hypothetical protein [Bacillota bacterium]